jgi:DNA-binding NarL/FixJ family response regulator
MRIILAEHHSKLLSALRTLITEKTDHVIAGEARDWAELLKQAEKTKPDLVLLDWELPNRPNNDLRADLCIPERGLRLIVLSTWTGVKEIALAAGADAFISKSESPDRLLEVL